MQKLILTKIEDNVYQVELGSLVRFRLDQNDKDMDTDELDHKYLNRMRENIIRDLYEPLFDNMQAYNCEAELIVKLRLDCERAMQVSFNDLDE